MPGRPTGFSIGSDYGVTYGYNESGQLLSVFSSALPMGNAYFVRLWNDQWQTVSERIGLVIRTTKLGEVDTYRTYEPNRDLVTSVENLIATDEGAAELQAPSGAELADLRPFLAAQIPGMSTLGGPVSSGTAAAGFGDVQPDGGGGGGWTGTVSHYDYAYDAGGRRQWVVRSGEQYPAGAVDTYAYNPRGELGDVWAHHDSLDPQDPGPLSDPGHYNYQFNPIGNRTSYQTDSDPATTYHATALNAYDLVGGQTYLYDDDGNLTQDDRFTYTWDAENRLIGATPRSPVAGSARVEFSYDYLGRRVEKRVFTYSGGWPSDPSDRLRFVYDGWNVVLGPDQA